MAYFNGCLMNRKNLMTMPYSYFLSCLPLMGLHLKFDYHSYHTGYMRWGRGDAHIHAEKFTIFFLSKENAVSCYYHKALLVNILSIGVTSAFPISLQFRKSRNVTQHSVKGSSLASHSETLHPVLHFFIPNHECQLRAEADPLYV